MAKKSKGPNVVVPQGLCKMGSKFPVSMVRRPGKLTVEMDMKDWHIGPGQRTDDHGGRAWHGTMTFGNLVGWQLVVGGTDVPAKRNEVMGGLKSHVEGSVKLIILDVPNGRGHHALEPQTVTSSWLWVRNNDATLSRIE